MAAIIAIGLPAAGGPADVRCSLDDERIRESSGVAASSWSDDVVFTHNDSGDAARFFAVDARTCATRADYQVTGASNVDWEDMTRSATPDGAPVLWLADIGDNGAKRPSVVVYEVDEPGPGAVGSVAIRSRWSLTYPDGPHDAETLIVDPETGRPVVVTKDSVGGQSRAYRAPDGGSGILEPLVGLDVRSWPGGGLIGPSWSLTSGATSPDRRSVVLRSYLAAWLWTTSPGEPLAVTLSRPPEPLLLPQARQAEAISFNRTGSGVWVTSEGAESPLSLVPLTEPPPGALPPPAVPAPGAAPQASKERPAALILVASGSALLLGFTILFRVWRRRRSDA